MPTHKRLSVVENNWLKDFKQNTGAQAPPSSASAHLLAIGVNYRTATVAFREQLAVFSANLPQTLTTLHRNATVNEAVILSTCNRVELYVATDNPQAACQDLVLFLSHLSGLSPRALVPHIYQHRGEAAARHLFRVAAGLDSMILGESEITAQVKQAYQVAAELGTTGARLNRFFQKALHSAKHVRASTGINEGQASIGSVIAKLAGDLFGDKVADCNVLLWGAGKAAEATTKHLMKLGVGQLWMVNRTQTKAEALASLCQGRWLSWERAINRLAHVDIAVVCTQAPHYVVDAGDLRAVSQARGQRPLFLVDLAVPRNIDPEIARLPNTRLYNIDDLQALVQEGVARRQGVAAECEMQINGQLKHLWRWWEMQTIKENMRCQFAAAL